MIFFNQTNLFLPYLNLNTFDFR